MVIPQVPVATRESATAFQKLWRMTMTNFLKIVRDSKGATAIEYGLIAALIAVAAIAAMQSIGTKLGTTFNNVSDKL